MSGKRDKDAGSVIVKKYEVAEGRHHSGAWKVAYADFVTAMMAFFLLMWLLNSTTEAQRKGLADYFSPSNLMSHASSGMGEPFGGHTPFDQGALASDRGSAQVVTGTHPVVENTDDGDDLVHKEMHRAKEGDGAGLGPSADDVNADDQPDPTSLGQSGMKPVEGPGGDQDRPFKGQPATQPQAPLAEEQQERAQKAAFEQAANQIREAVRSDPALAELSKQLAIDITPEGLRVQIMDEIKLPMFTSGSSMPNDRTRILIRKVIPILTKLSRPISIAGYTDAAPFPGPGRSNWELSADRANATRRLLIEEGFPDTLIQSVTGHADRDPLLPADPLAAANRRIAIMVLRQPSAPTDHAPAGPDQNAKAQ